MEYVLFIALAIGAVVLIVLLIKKAVSALWEYIMVLLGVALIIGSIIATVNGFTFAIIGIVFGISLTVMAIKNLPRRGRSHRSSSSSSSSSSNYSSDDDYDSGYKSPSHYASDLAFYTKNALVGKGIDIIYTSCDYNAYNDSIELTVHFFVNNKEYISKVHDDEDSIMRDLKSAVQYAINQTKCPYEVSYRAVCDD